MGQIRDRANVVYPNGPVSAPTQPLKEEIRALFGVVEDTISGAIAGPVSVEAAARAAADAALSVRVDNVEALAATGIKNRLSVKLATTTAGTLASSFENGDTIDGIVLATGDRILIKNQAAPAENGVYTVAASGAPTRDINADQANELEGLAVYVEQGVTLVGTTWFCKATSITVGTTPLFFAWIASDKTGLVRTEADAWVEGFGTADAVTVDSVDRIASVNSGTLSYNWQDKRVRLNGQAEKDFDLIVYGGTLSGIMAAKRARLRGLRVALVDPYPRIGGAIVQGGLVVTDFPSPQANWHAVRGLVRQFFQSILRNYDDPVAARAYVDATTQMLQIYDPRAFQAEIKAWTEDFDLIVVNNPIFDPSDIRQAANRAITEISTNAGWLRGKVFVDASYEGDLIRAAGVGFRIGREGQGTFGEPFAGFKPVGSGAFSLAGFTTPPDGRLVQTAAQMTALGLSAGNADPTVQTLSVRSILTQHGSRVPFTAPPGYNKANYLAAGEGAKLFGYTQLVGPTIGSGAIANQGTVNLRNGVSCKQTNNGSASIVSNELWWAGTEYALGNWARRREIVEQQARWQQGLYYYLANDIVSDWNTASTIALQADAATWGLAPDLYPYSRFGQHWQDGVYVRECMRMTDAAYVCTQADMYASGSPNIPSGYETWHSNSGRTNTKNTVIARWAYFLDAHATRIYTMDSVAPFTYVFEGTTPHPNNVDLYEIPWAAVRTDPLKATHVPNLLVSWCYGMSHVFYMSARMEPLAAMVGEACGEAAALMVVNQQATNQVVYADLAARLNQFGSKL